jgi:molybdopterin-guanine dinucleotide biosynthesis protein A
MKVRPLLPVYILAGGRASRFGSDKARARYQQQPLLCHGAAAVEPWAASLTVIADQADKYADLGFSTLVDQTPGAGPMGGLATALADAPPGYILVGSCDVLGLTPSLLAPLLLAPRQALALAFYTQHWHPLWALYHTALLPQVAARLQRGEGALWRLLEAVGAQAIEGSQFARCVHPINTPHDLARFEASQGEPLGGHKRLKEQGMVPLPED